MDNRYSADTITIGDGDPAVVDHLNDILESAGQGRPLGAPTRTFGDRAVVPVRDRADPLAVCGTLQAAATAVDPRPELAFYSGTNQSLDRSADFIGRDVGHFTGPESIGRDVGHLAGHGSESIGRDVGHFAGHGPESIGRDVGHLAGHGPEPIGQDVGHLAGPHSGLGIGEELGHHPHSIGRDVGHGLTYAELPLDFDEPPKPVWKPLAEGLRRPVIALFDTGVQGHSWLPDDPDDPFVLPATGWSSPVAEPQPGRPKTGHATFVAGLIRLNAPSARVLSVRVMDGEGKVLESTLVEALLWLEHYRERNPVDVLLMPFGRPPGDLGDEHILAEIHAPIERLARAGVAIVASAGNDHRSDGIHPALFDDVIAVGAGFGDYHAVFSNFGDWVDRYREGVNALSTLPGDRWGRWSGTSFSAAVFAADLARPHVV
jgi:hypothetical protein